MNSIFRSALKINNIRCLLNPAKNLIASTSGNQQRQIARNLWYMCSSQNNKTDHKNMLNIKKPSMTCSCGCNGVHTKGECNICIYFNGRQLSLPFVAEKELVEFLTEEILAERKAQKMKTIPTEIDGFKATLNGAEVTLTKDTGNET